MAHVCLGMPGIVTISQHMPPGNAIVSHEITIPNDLVGCVIGRGGSKINEIRFDLLKSICQLKLRLKC